MKPSILAIMLAALVLPQSGVVAADQAQNLKNSKPAVSYGHRGAKTIHIDNLDGATITYIKPDLSSQSITPVMGRITMPVSGVDNYHALVVEKDWGDHKEVIIRYQYMFGRPSKQNPVRLTAAEKSEFEIVPNPLPREHYRYHSQQAWQFLARYQGEFVANQPLTLSTSNGSEQTLNTDQHGRVTFLIPDDFPGLIEGERNKQSAQFTISGEYQEGDTTYSTQLVSDYRVNPSHWQSTEWGVLVLGIGFLAGGYLGQNLKKRDKKA
ncbi:MAG: hypothetical protein JAY99_05685 [Candidatus Thiodiazotropha lotti]|nr:hypothetical protein [Candidatus Thiodiazotropha lotti]MCG7998996.1 hypothetical protein [Candidatus Thiodiazotropha lotti]MCW4182021.1 hypothetical protein [Candidatus Thiodiazotropha weberae]MCW4190764.1 hypothetical protein [Candidatus Thiodiazotropha weberae]